MSFPDKHLFETHHSRRFGSWNDCSDAAEEVDERAAVQNLGNNSVRSLSGLCVGSARNHWQLRVDQLTFQRQNDTVLCRIGVQDLRGFQSVSRDRAGNFASLLLL